MKTTPSTTIHMEPSKVTVTTVNADGIKKSTNTNIENIQQIFMNQQSIETPFLPSQWGVVKYYRKDHYEGYVLTKEATERKVMILQGNTGNELILPLPPMIWFFEIMTNPTGDKTLTHSMTYVIKHELLSMSDIVYHAPYPNIGTSNGICWGAGNLPAVPTSKSIQNIPARFFTQPFNNDLAHNRVKPITQNHPAITRNTPGSDHAVTHMKMLAYDLEECKKEGKPFIYPFETLKETANMTVEKAARMSMPNLFR